MIRSYTVDELQMMSGFTRRTISDYISKGLLVGPSHRGRGARYCQADADALRVVPRIRTLMKKEFPTVESVASFLRVISQQELRDLACQPSEMELDLKVRRIRVRVSMATVLPLLAPERLTEVVDSLSPEQICGIDKGQYQLGAILDLAELFHESNGADKNSNGADKNSNGVDKKSNGVDKNSDRYRDYSNEEIEGQAELSSGDDRRGSDSKLRLVKSPVSDYFDKKNKPAAQSNSDEEQAITDMRLGDIAERLVRLEKLLDES